jgi:hypothetical protein
MATTPLVMTTGQQEAPAPTDQRGDLTQSEAERLAELESAIERGKKTFIEVGNALAEIRDRRLYRRDWPTFEAYCIFHWGWSRQRSYQLIEAAAVVKLLPDALSTIVDAESQARELAKVAAEDRENVMREVIRRGSVTASAIQKVARELKGKVERPAPDHAAMHPKLLGGTEAVIRDYWLKATPEKRGRLILALINTYGGGNPHIGGEDKGQVKVPDKHAFKADVKWWLQQHVTD